MNDRDNFLSRWSRRKSEQQREAKRTEQDEKVRPPAPDRAPAPQGASRPAALPGPVKAEHPIFDPASLPALESIGADTDIRAFLQPGVPADLRNAALRRAWSADPAIRDFRGLAESDWDFNDPNGIPGFGALDPGLDVKKMASALFGDGRDDDGRKRDEPDAERQDEALIDNSVPGDAGDSAPAALKSREPTGGSPAPGDLVQREENIASQNKKSESDSPPVKRRRPRGGALPQS